MPCPFIYPILFSNSLDPWERRKGCHSTCLFLREFCLATENADVEDVLVSEPVKEEKVKIADDVFKAVTTEIMKAERVEEEFTDKRKFLKTNRVCQFFNIC